MGEFVVIGKRDGEKIELAEGQTLEDLDGEFTMYDEFDNFKLIYREGYTEHRLFNDLGLDELVQSIQEKAGNG